MGQDVAADRLATVCTCEESAGSGIALHLVRHKDSDIEFWKCVSVHSAPRLIEENPVGLTFGNVRQFRQKLIELLLTLIELTATDVVDTEQGHDAVDDEETVLVVHEILGNLVEKLHLMLRIDRTSISDVFES